jgi:hypothetical protein
MVYVNFIFGLLVVLLISSLGQAQSAVESDFSSIREAVSEFQMTRQQYIQDNLNFRPARKPDQQDVDIRILGQPQTSNLMPHWTDSSLLFAKGDRLIQKMDDANARQNPTK